jgi:large subunit ribosomal protein L10
MDEPRADKVAVVTEVTGRLQESGSVVVTEYRGLSVKALQQLRRDLRPVGGSYKVYKNTLVRRAADQADVALADHLTGPTALAFAEPLPDGGAADIVSVAKVLRDFAKTNPSLVIKGGLLEGEPMDASAVQQLADLDSREVLLARLAGMLAAPMQQFAALLQAVPQGFAYGLQALIDSGGASGASGSPLAASAEADTTSDSAATGDGADTNDSDTSDTATNDGEE